MEEEAEEVEEAKVDVALDVESADCEVRAVTAPAVWESTTIEGDVNIGSSAVNTPPSRRWRKLTSLEEGEENEEEEDE